MRQPLHAAIRWLAGIALLLCMAALFRAYWVRNVEYVRPVANMFHVWWNALVLP